MNFPSADCRYFINGSWMLEVPSGFTHSSEADGIVLLRCGLSLSIQSFSPSQHTPLERQFATLLREVPRQAFGFLEQRELEAGRFGYRLLNIDASSAPFLGVVVGTRGYVRLKATFQREVELEVALAAWRSVRETM